MLWQELRQTFETTGEEIKGIREFLFFKMKP